MSAEVYEILALLMRYVFIFIGLLIVWRSFRWLRRDARAYKKEMQALPDAGLVGEMVNLATGEAYPLPHEGTIGSSRSCDIRLKGSGILGTHARFAFEEGKGLKIMPARRGHVLLGGVEVQGAGYALHGTQLQLGDAALRVRLFAGLNVPHPAAYPEPDEILGSDVYLESWAGPEEGAAGFPALMDGAVQEEPEYVPYSTLSYPPGAPLEGYDGEYTDDGQMTWQYAYSMDELRQAMDDPALRQMEEEDEAVPYQSPVERRRRRRRRHDP